MLHAHESLDQIVDRVVEREWVGDVTVLEDVFLRFGQWRVHLHQGANAPIASRARHESSRVGDLLECFMREEKLVLIRSAIDNSLVLKRLDETLAGVFGMPSVQAWQLLDGEGHSVWQIDSTDRLLDLFDAVGLPGGRAGRVMWLSPDRDVARVVERPGSEL